MPDDSPNKDYPKNDSSKSREKKTPESSSSYTRLRTQFIQTRERFLPLIRRPGVHTRNYLLAAGFEYTGDGDTARCEQCGFEVSNWTADMVPFTIHSQQKPNCPFVLSIKAFSFSSATDVHNTSMSNEQQDTSERHGIESVELGSSSNSFIESDLLKQVRRRTFSHWPHRTIPSSAQMIEAGFFNCNVEDRVICIYCNLICEQWTPHVDNPCEVHKTLKPDCIYAKSVLVRREPPPIINENQILMRVTANRSSLTSNNINSLRISERVRPVVHSSTSSNDKSLSINDEIQANYFYTDTKTNVTCIYCNGLLQKESPDDNPMIEHAQWFPNCGYAKQLCDDEMCRKIQEFNRAQQEHARANEPNEKTSASAMLNTNLTTQNGLLLIPDESTLSKLVTARLNLPISQILSNRNFELSIIQRCWEDQLRLKGEDFVSGCDLHVACLILKKQEEHIRDGRDVVIPSERMRQFREHAMQEQAKVLEQRRAAKKSTSLNATQSSSMNASIGHDVEMIPSSQSSVDSISKSTTTEDHGRARSITEATCTINVQDQSVSSAPTDPCAVCFLEKKELAFLPCGHLATCVPCGYSLNLCPICRREKEAVVKIYLQVQ